MEEFSDNTFNMEELQKILKRKLLPQMEELLKAIIMKVRQIGWAGYELFFTVNMWVLWVGKIKRTVCFCHESNFNLSVEHKAYFAFHVFACVWPNFFQRKLPRWLNPLMTHGNWKLQLQFWRRATPLPFSQLVLPQILPAKFFSKFFRGKNNLQLSRASNEKEL